MDLFLLMLAEFKDYSASFDSVDVPFLPIEYDAINGGHAVHIYNVASTAYLDIMDKLDDREKG